jgi:exodeoxyribonuclease-1
LRERILLSKGAGKWGIGAPAIFVGFNSIRFDEEMLRHALFQCLYPAYLTSNHRNCRTDALSLVMAADAVSPAQRVVPLGAEGR